MTRMVNDQATSTVELLTSEVVTNAIIHAGSAPELVVRLSRGRVRVEVNDGSEAPAVRRRAGPLAAGGKGLVIVDALAPDWGVEVFGDGKRVWFEVPFTTRPTPAWARSRARRGAA